MRYFEILQLEPSFTIEASKLKKAYYQASRSTHPDHHGADDEAVILQSSLVNLAYKTLRDQDLRIKYILEQEGLITDDQQLTVSQDFLMEMMDVNEALMELEMEPDQAQLLKVETEVSTLHQSLLDEAAPAMQAYDQGDKSVLDRVLSYYVRARYLSRIKEKLS